MNLVNLFCIPGTLLSIMNLLLVGVGGVGCEFLIVLEEYFSNPLVPNPFNIVIIDDDTVEESNLNRQRLFKRDDIGRSKVEVASEALKKLSVTPLKKKVEEIGDAEFFNQFELFVLAVDNLETRRWMNSTIHQAFKTVDFFLLDLGVEGFKFSLRSVSLGRACLECTINLYAANEEDEEASIPICSIYGQPRNLKDCIYWSLHKIKNCDLEFSFDSVYELARERCKEFGIDSTDLSWQLIQSLMKRTVPAVASINSFLAVKGLEILLNRREIESNYWLINLENGIYEFETVLEKHSNCFICN